MTLWRGLIYGATALLATAFLYVLLRWRRAPMAVRGMAFVAGLCFFSGILSGIWIFHALSQQLEVAPEATKPSPGGSLSQSIAAVTAVARPTVRATPRPAPSVAAMPVPTAWLARVNFYRALAKLQPVTEDVKLSTGDMLHARYLVKNRSLPLDSTAHNEDPANPWFTPEGLAAARGGDDVIPPCPGCLMRSATEAIDLWVTGPFHRILILNPSLSRIGYGEFQESGLKAHVLGLPAPSPRSALAPIMFPGDGTTVALNRFDGVEWPAPLAACAGFHGFTGLPVTLELGGDVAAVVEQHRFSEDDRALEHCVFDASSYTNPVVLEQEWGRNILKLYGGVVLIPHEPLAAGRRYSVELLVSGRKFSWSFSVGPLIASNPP